MTTFHQTLFLHMHLCTMYSWTIGLVIVAMSHSTDGNQGSEQCDLLRITHFKFKNHITVTGRDELGRIEGGKLFRIDSKSNG